MCHTSRPIASVCSVSTHQRSPRPKQLVTTIIATSPAKHQVQQICIWILFSGVMLKPQPNPMIPQCYLHLQINGQVIAHDLQASLCSAAMTPECHTYMQKKLKSWTPHNCENVNWISLKFALQQLDCSDHQWLQKFLHDWLPLHTALHMAQPASDHMCPVCWQAMEDFWHFLECQHPTWQLAYQQLQAAIQKLHTTHCINPHMLQLLWQCVNSVHNQYPIDKQYSIYPAVFQLLYTDQQCIG